MFFEPWFEKFNGHPDFSPVTRALENNGRIWASGVWGPARAFVAASALWSLRRPALLVCVDEAEALALHEELRFFLQGFPSWSHPERQAAFQVKYPTVLDPGEDPLVYFPANEYSVHDPVNREYGRTLERLLILRRLARGEPMLVVCSLQAATQHLVPPEVLEGSLFSLEQGQDYSLDQLSRRLVDLGYRREAAVEEPGQFSIRGGILDLAAPDSDFPVRLEFNSDTLESLRPFDAASQKSLGRIERVEVLPFQELVLDDQARAEGLKRVEASALKPLAREHWRETLADQRHFLGQEWLLPYFYPKSSLFDYLARLTPKAVLVLDQPQQARERLEADFAQARQVQEERSRESLLFPDAGALLLDWDELVREAARFPCLFTSLLPHTLSEFKGVPGISLTFKSHNLTRGDLELFCRELAVFSGRDDQALIASGSHGELTRLKEILDARGVKTRELGRTAPGDCPRARPA